MSKPDIKVVRDALKYGTGIVKVGRRKWWNPLRYIKGVVYRKRVSLEEVFK